MSNWRTVGVRLKDEQVAVLNQRLGQLGYSTLGEFVGGLADSVITNKQLVEDLADVLSERIVNKLLTSPPAQRESPLAVESVKSHGWDSIPRPPAYKAGALPG